MSSIPNLECASSLRVEPLLAESLCIGGLGLDSFVCAPAHVCVLIVEAERHLSLGALLELKG